VGVCGELRVLQSIREIETANLSDGMVTVTPQELRYAYPVVRERLLHFLVETHVTNPLVA
jgi:hypothetical protein